MGSRPRVRLARVALRRRVLAAALLGAVLGGAWLAAPVLAQEVAPRLTGAMVLDELGKVQQAAAARASASGDAGATAVAGKLAAMSAALKNVLGGKADEPTATLGADQRGAVVHADAAAKRVQAWLDASTVACTKDDLAAMLAAVSAVVDELAADTASQKAPLPVIDGVETLDKRPLFVLRPGKDAPRFVLTGENLVDAQCANPNVVALDAAGHPAPVQPHLVAAQSGRVEMNWAGADKLAPGSYTLQLTAQRKAFLIGCTSQPAALTVLQIAPAQTFTVNYALVASCGGNPAPVPLDSQTVSISGRGQTVTRNIDGAACTNPGSYTLTAAAHANNGEVTTMGPVTQGADASITAGVGNGITISWEPALRQLFVRSGQQGCKGIY